MAVNAWAWPNWRKREMRPILVAGKSGQLARCLVDIGKLRALPIVAFGRAEFDLENSCSIDRVVDAVLPRAIVNAAAYTAVDKAESEPERAFAVNRDGARRLAATARRIQVPFVHVSTDYVFDGRKSSPYREEDAPCPLGVYGRSKLEGELAVMDKNPDALIFRTSWVYSPYGTNFLRTMLRLADTRDVVRVVDDQSGVTDGCHRPRECHCGCSRSGHRKKSPSSSWHLSRGRRRRDDVVRLRQRDLFWLAQSRVSRPHA